MAWIESHQELRNHPKLAELSRLLGGQPPHLAGHLHFLWWWCMDYAMDGNISRYNVDQIAAAAGWAADSAKFVQAMVASEFIDVKDGKMHIHDWFDFCGEIISKRLERKKSRRKTADNGSRIPPNSAEKPPTVPDLTVPDLTRPITPLPPKGGFELIWAKYPSKKNSKAARKHYDASVKTMKDFLDIQCALENYLKTDTVKRGFIQNGSTWFNNWRDYVNYKDPVSKMPKYSDAGAPLPDDIDTKYDHLIEGRVHAEKP